jgi:hypothetical protein
VEGVAFAEGAVEGDFAAGGDAGFVPGTLIGSEHAGHLTSRPANSSLTRYDFWHLQVIEIAI